MKTSNKKQPPQDANPKPEPCAHNWVNQFTGTALIYHKCSKCGAEKFE